MKQTLDAYVDRLTGLDGDKVDQLVEEAKALIGDRPWIPNPGPQTEAFGCASVKRNPPAARASILGVSIRHRLPP